jgi:hypothetical protein
MVERTKDDAAQVNINAVSRIMKVYIFSRLTDLYGDIPYFDAAKGYYTKVFAPTYDKQQDIYDDFFKELDAATKSFDPSKAPVTQDFYFNGDLAKWKKFGNSLRLRLALRLTKVDQAKAKTEAEAAIAGGVMQSNADMAVMQHANIPFDGEKPAGGNGLSHTFMNSSPIESAFRMCTTFIDYMVSTSDPRLTMFGRSYLKDGAVRADVTDITDKVFDQVGNYHDMGLAPSTFSYEIPAGEGNITINVNGTATPVTPILKRLQPSKFITANNAPYIIMSYAEVELWMAEAAFRGWTTGSSADDHFSKALEAGVTQMTVYGAPEASATALTNFVTSNTLIPGKELEQINSQLWVNFALNGQEAYANWRRSGFPAIVYPNRDPGVNQSNGKIPRRMQYPVEEYILNETNVTAASARLSDGKDLWTNSVWWDQQ